VGERLLGDTEVIGHGLLGEPGVLAPPRESAADLVTESAIARVMPRRVGRERGLLTSTLTTILPVRLSGALMSDPSTTTLSSKGQVVIPEEIRERLGLKVGAQFVVLGDKDVVIFKMLQPPAKRDFTALVQQARQAAKQTGMRRAEITAAVGKVRRARRAK
jgi:AbrB family looped-hinge helix DNA binding protein